MWAEECTPALPEEEHMSKDPSPNSQLPPPQSSQGSSQSALESAFPEEEGCLNSQEGRLRHEVQQGRVPQIGEQEVQAGQVPQQRDTQKGKMSQRQGGQGQIQQVQQEVNLCHPYGRHVCCISSLLLCS